ncbi:PPOX class F420-dependent oxidoreductase [Streptomyces sp.]|uniref:PPOX class F420-dependent oxidoreductase n=1 Tax=Streptomyces sp. TaxID=1931 RepID=UPI002F4204C3
MTEIPASHRDMLERPLFGHLGTVKPDGTPQVTPVWYVWDGEFLSFTTSTLRRKYHHVVANPSVSLSINDPLQPYRYLEVRGTVERIEPDTDADFFFELAARYELGMGRGDLNDTPYRVRIMVRPTHTTQQG